MPADTSKILHECIAEQLINMGPAALGNTSYGPRTRDDKSPDFSDLSMAKTFLMSGIKMTLNLAQFFSDSWCHQAMEQFIQLKVIIMVPMVM